MPQQKEHQINGRQVTVDTIISALYKQKEQYTHIIIDGKKFTPTGTTDKDRQEEIEKLMNDNSLYYEKILEVTTSGIYRTGTECTRIIVQANDAVTTRTYVIYTKI